MSSKMVWGEVLVVGDSGKPQFPGTNAWVLRQLKSFRDDASMHGLFGPFRTESEAVEAMANEDERDICAAGMQPGDIDWTGLDEALADA